MRDDVSVAPSPTATAASGVSAMPTEDGLRRFRVHAHHEDVRHGRILAEATFEAAAIAYAEHLAVPADRHHVAVLVHDIDSGREHSFVIHLETGAASSAAPTEPDPTR